MTGVSAAVGAQPEGEQSQAGQRDKRLHLLVFLVWKEDFSRQCCPSGEMFIKSSAVTVYKVCTVSPEACADQNLAHMHLRSRPNQP